MSDASHLSVSDLMVTLESPHYDSGVCRQAARELARLTVERDKWQAAYASLVRRVIQADCPEVGYE